MVFYPAALILPALLSLATALPPRPDAPPPPPPLVEDRSAVNYKELPKYHNALPSCEGEANDPSHMIPRQQYTKFNYGQGARVPKTGPREACWDGDDEDNTCWTEFWLVESSVEYDQWENTGAAIDCRSTSSCNSANAVRDQQCTSNMKGNNTGWDWQIVEAKMEKVIPTIDKKMHLGTKINTKWGDQASTTTQACSTDITQTTCQWDDGQCHQVWLSNRNRRITGYMARVCKPGETEEKQSLWDGIKDKVGSWFSGGGGKQKQKQKQDADNNNAALKNAPAQQNFQRPDGAIMRGMVDFSFVIPINRLVGCNSLCNMFTYNDTVPLNSAPFPVPVDLFTANPTTQSTQQ